MSYVVMALVLLIAIVMQSLFQPIRFLGGASYPFLCSVVLYYGFMHGRGMMMISALLAGVLYDSLSPMMPLGYSAVCFAAVTWAAGQFRSYVIADSVLTPMFFGLVCSCAVSVMMWIMLVSSDAADMSFWRMLLKSAGTGVIALVVTPVVFSIAGGMDKLVGNIEEVDSLNEFE